VTCAGVLLTGGASRRMGTDKATIVIDGETLAARAARVLAAACEPVIEVGPGVSGLPHVRENPPGAGPLVALVAGADALAADTVLLFACDLPFVEAAELTILAKWPGTQTVIPIADDRPQYACARYGPAALAGARAALRDGERALKSIAGIDAEYVPIPAHVLADIDTPEDLRRLGLT
jgi:molybdenum cofactor guanylyltransferase